MSAYAFLDIKIGEERCGRIIIELFKDVVPKTVENFLSLCRGDFGIGKFGKLLRYQNSVFHRVVPQFMVQGGDIIKGDGSSGESIYGEIFEDENFHLLHNKEGTVGMANAGANTNSSQFYITTVPCPHLDNINVVFGQVIKGLNIIREMENVPRINDSPIEICIIENCGELRENEPWNIGENDGTMDIYPPWPDDWDDRGTNIQLEDVIIKIKDSGNFYFKKHNYNDSDRKYRKALRYIDYLYTKGCNFDRKLVEEMKINSLLNLAAVRLKKKKYQDANLYCEQALKLNPQNGKALYRRGQARIGLKEYDKAVYDLKSAYKLCPYDKIIQLELYNAKRMKHNYLQVEKKLFTKMFQ